MSNIDKELDELEVEFVHGVPVKLPTKAKEAILALIAREATEALYKVKEVYMSPGYEGSDGELIQDIVKATESAIAELQQTIEGRE